MPPTDEKFYYKIGEVAKKISVEPHVIRYWETEFAFLKPYKSKGSQRLYSKSDIEKILLIKDYLYDKKFTIEGARNAIRLSRRQDAPAVCENGGGGTESGSPAETGDGVLGPSAIKEIRNELNSIKSILSLRKNKTDNQK